MPRIDDLNIQKKVFTKKKYRSWDENLVDQLKIKTNSEGSIEHAPQENENKNHQRLEVIPTQIPKGQYGVEGQETPILDHPITAQPISDTKETRDEPNSTILADISDTKMGGNRHKRDTNRTQDRTQSKTNNENITETYRGVSSLTGNSLKIFKAIIIECNKNQSYETNFLEKKSFCTYIDVKPTAFKTTCHRLKIRGYVTDIKTVRGRNSIWKFTVNPDSHREFLLLEGIRRDTISDTEVPSSSSSSLIKKTTTNDFPPDWKTVDLSRLKKVLRGVGESFSSTHLKNVFKHCGDKLTGAQIQSSIDHFTFGLESFPEEGRYKRRVKICTLTDSLKDGDVFVEPKYLSEAEQSVFQIYKKMLASLESEKKVLFKSWISTDTEKKKEYFKAKLPSTHYFGDNEFVEMATKHFNEVEWGAIKQEKLEVLGELELLKRFEAILAESQGA